MPRHPWVDHGRPATAPEPGIEMRFADGGVIVLELMGTLDGDTGQALEQAAMAVAASDGTTRLDIDLRGLEGYTPEGADALVACRTHCAGLAGGLHYRTGRGPGREALLAAYSRQQ